MHRIMRTGFCLVAIVLLIDVAVLAKPLVHDRLSLNQTSDTPPSGQPCPEEPNRNRTLSQPLSSTHGSHSPFHNTTSVSSGNSTNLPLSAGNNTHSPFGNNTDGLPCPSGQVPVHGPVSTGSPRPLMPIPFNGTHSPFGNATHGSATTPCPTQTNSTHAPLHTAGHQPAIPLPSGGAHGSFGNGTHSPFGNGTHMPNSGTEPCHNSSSLQSPNSNSTTLHGPVSNSTSSTWTINKQTVELNARCRLNPHLPGCHRLFRRANYPYPDSTSPAGPVPGIKRRALRGALKGVRSLLRQH